MLESNGSVVSVPWPTTWIDWCGVIGFVISVIFTIRELLKSRTNVTFTGVRAYVYPAYQYRTGNMCVLKGVMQNRSLSPIAVCSLALVDDMKSYHPAYNEPHVLFTSTRNWGDKRTTSAVTTALPLNLSPYESRYVTILFYVESKTVQPSWLPERTILDTGESLPEELRKRHCPPKDRPPEPLERRTIRLFVGTSRKAKERTVQVDTYPALQLVYEIPEADG